MANYTNHPQSKAFREAELMAELMAERSAVRVECQDGIGLELPPDGFLAYAQFKPRAVSRELHANQARPGRLHSDEPRILPRHGLSFGRLD
jgi:hypothetical protein